MEGSSAPFDERFIARIRTGDAAAFETLFRAFVAPLTAFAFRFVRSQDIAAELVQEVFFAIWRQHERLTVSGNVKAYLYSAVRHRALDHLKHETVERRWAEQSVRDPLARTDVPSEAMDAAIHSAEFTAVLQTALTTLSERRRLTFLLRFRDGLSYAEIAQHMGVSVKTVENQLARALQSLRAQLGTRV